MDRVEDANKHVDRIEQTVLVHNRNACHGYRCEGPGNLMGISAEFRAHAAGLARDMLESPTTILLKAIEAAALLA